MAELKPYKRMVSSTYFDFRNPFGIKSNFATLPSLTRLLLRCIVGFDKSFFGRLQGKGKLLHTSRWKPWTTKTHLESQRYYC